MTAATVDDVTRTARDTTRAQWTVAGVVMAASMASGGFTFHYLHEPWPLGIVTALSVDLALAAWLRIAPRLRDAGITSKAGWVLEGASAAMTVYLNVGAAAFRDGVDAATERFHLGVMHCFIPVVFVLVSVANSDAHTKLQRVHRDREAQDQNARDAQLVADRAEFERQQRERLEIERRRANGELVEASDVLRAAQARREQAQREASEATRLLEVAQQERMAAEAEVAATRAAAEKLAKQRKPVAAARKRGKPTASMDEKCQWVRKQRALGLNPRGADVDEYFDPDRTGPRTGYRAVARVEREIDAELAKVAGGTR